MQRTIEDYFELFTKKHWNRLQQVLQLTDLQNEHTTDYPRFYR